EPRREDDRGDRKHQPAEGVLARARRRRRGRGDSALEPGEDEPAARQALAGDGEIETSTAAVAAASGACQPGLLESELAARAADELARLCEGDLLAEAEPARDHVVGAGDRRRGVAPRARMKGQGGDGSSPEGEDGIA